jgi:hypothetical protein
MERLATVTSPRPRTSFQMANASSRKAVIRMPPAVPAPPPPMNITMFVTMSVSGAAAP